MVVSNAMDKPTARRWTVAIACLWLGSCSLLVDPSTEIECTTHADCRSWFDGYGFCRPTDKVCARLFTEDCAELHYFRKNPERENGAFTRVPEGFGEDGIILGFMAPPSYQADLALAAQPGAEPSANPLRHAAIEAIAEIQGIYPAGAAQNLALLDCNDHRDAARVFRHLADQVQAPAVIGPALSATARALLYPENELDKNDHTMLLSPAAAAVTLGGVHDLLWRTVPSDRYQVQAMVRMLDEVRAAASDQNTLVIACREPAQEQGEIQGWCHGFRDEFSDALGLTPEERAMVPVYDRPLDPDNPVRNLSDVIGGTLDRDPRAAFIVGIGTGELGTHFIPILEGPLARELGYKPRYLFPDAERLDGLKSTIAESADPYDLASRILGTAPGARNDPQDEPLNLLRRRFLAIEDGTLAEFAYDAVYLLVYALYRTGRAHPSGRDVANAMKTLSCPEAGAVQLRPDADYASGGNRIAGNQQCANYDGISGPLDFSEEGQAPNNISFWCPVVRTRAEGGPLTADDVEFAAPPGLAGAAAPYWDVTSEEGRNTGGVLRNAESLTFCGTRQATRSESVSDGGVEDADPGT